MSENKEPKLNSYQKPYIVAVKETESENFVKDVFEGASKLHKKKPHKRIFLKSFLLGFSLFLVSLYILYTSYYFINHVFWPQHQDCHPLP